MQLPKSLSRVIPVTEGGRETWINLLPLLVSAVLVVLLAWQLVQLAWTVLGARGAAPSVATPPATETAAAPARQPIDVQAIVNAHLFGVATAEGAGEVDPNAVAATQMSLVLVGTIAESDPEKGLAIIGESAANAKVYAVGKTIAGGTKLHSVYPDRVILDRGGNLEALMLPKQFQGTASLQNAPTPQMPTGMDDMGMGDRLRNMAAQNPAAITDIIRPQPVFANGQQRGYRVYPGRNRNVFGRLGLQPGDLVTAINGTPLDDPARGMEILQSINSAAAVTVTVERNGQTSQVTINNAQFTAESAAAADVPPDPVPVNEMPAMPSPEESTE
jgi:general secretion pathway protein C